MILSDAIQAARMVKRLGLHDGLPLSLKLLFSRSDTISAKTGSGTNYFTVNDKTQFYHILNSTEKLEKIASCVPRSAENILDIGGNVGLFSLLVAQSHPNAKIVCIEADPKLAEIARRNLSQLENVTVIAAGIDLKDGERPFYFSKSSNQLGSFNREAVEPFTKKIEEIVVETIAIEKIFQDFPRIDFMKIDIQGYEASIFNEASQHLLNKIDRCVFEMSVLDPGFFQLARLLTDEFEDATPLHSVHGGADVLFQRQVKSSD